jgi:hypothetical protein
MSTLIKNLSEITSEAVAEFQKSAQTPATGIVDDLRKSGVNQATGLTAYDLQAPAKQLFPVLTPLRNKIPRVSGGGDVATRWKAVTAINASKLRGFVPEGRRNGQVSTTVVPKSSAYKTLGLEDAITIEAELAAMGFENIRSTQAQRLLWATMIEEELADLGANNSVALGTPTAPTVAIGTSGGTIADDAGGYNCYVVALTLHGYLAASLTDGVQQLITVTTPVNTTFTYGGGSSMHSLVTNSGAVSNAGASTLKLSTPVVAGAVAYAWYVGAHDGTATLQAITTLNSVVLTALTTTHQALSAITDDFSESAIAYDGILYQAWAPGSNAYIKNMATGTPGTGTGLTADNAGGIVEIDDMLASLWENYKLSPNTIYVNAREGKNITKKILGGTGVQYRIDVDQGQGFTAGAMVTRYMNKFAMGTDSFVDIMVHPFLPPGLLNAVTDQLPYPVTGIPNVMEKRLRRDYYQMEWPMRERQYETGVYCDGVLAHYFPPSLAIIANIADA